MDLLAGLTAAVDYVEENLDGEINYTAAAQIACHFPRMFSALAGIPLSEYIRRRRLTKAAFELQTGVKVIDAAIKYGYDSPDAFTRAFKALHGVTPARLKESGAPVKAYPRISFQITIKGENAMEYRIEKRIDTQLRLVGKWTKIETEKAFRQIPKFWRDSQKDGFQQALIDMAWVDPKCILESLVGICGASSSLTDESFSYFAGVRFERDLPEGMEEYLLPPCTYAVFPDAVDAWKRLYAEWVPTSGYTLADQPCIEHYLAPGGKVAHELWVPVLEK